LEDLPAVLAAHLLAEPLSRHAQHILAMGALRLNHLGHDCSCAKAPPSVNVTIGRADAGLCSDDVAPVLDLTLL
jgi:hypothetical protein